MFRRRKHEEREEEPEGGGEFVPEPLPPEYFEIILQLRKEGLVDGEELKFLIDNMHHLALGYNSDVDRAYLYSVLEEILVHGRALRRIKQRLEKTVSVRINARKDYILLSKIVRLVGYSLLTRSRGGFERKLVAGVPIQVRPSGGEWRL